MRILWLLIVTGILVLPGCVPPSSPPSGRKASVRELVRTVSPSKREPPVAVSKPLPSSQGGEQKKEEVSGEASLSEGPKRAEKESEQVTPEAKGGENPVQGQRERVPSSPSPSLGEGKARLAIIIDDVGYSLRQIEPFLEIPAPLTFSLLPEAPQKRLCLQRILSQGRVAMLHLPMEPLDSRLMPPNAITTDLSEQAIQSRVHEWLAELPGVKGVNNHMGSRATRDRRVMQAVLEVVKEKGLFFVDSRTTGDTVGGEVAEQLGVPYGMRDGRFLDNGGRTEEAYEILLELGRIALEKGSAIGIGHPHPGTARAIARALPILRQQGVEIVPVTDLVR
jgi:polysaccharide deacetylase 2 family uncharacterized protein YibQ